MITIITIPTTIGASRFAGMIGMITGTGIVMTGTMVGIDMMPTAIAGRMTGTATAIGMSGDESVLFMRIRPRNERFVCDVYARQSDLIGRAG